MSKVKTPRERRGRTTALSSRVKRVGREPEPVSSVSVENTFFIDRPTAEKSAPKAHVRTLVFSKIFIFAVATVPRCTFCESAPKPVQKARAVTAYPSRAGARAFAFRLRLRVLECYSRAMSSTAASAATLHASRAYAGSGASTARLKRCAVLSQSSRAAGARGARGRARRGGIVEAKIWTDDGRRKAAELMGLTREVRRDPRPDRADPRARTTAPRARRYKLVSRRPLPCGAHAGSRRVGLRARASFFAIRNLPATPAPLRHPYCRTTLTRPTPRRVAMAPHLHRKPPTAKS